ncbi:MAG: hypothetical protein LUE93_10995 [Bacteroides sp.]|nr:hypothetical protein [Bacteroides sp.]
MKNSLFFLFLPLTFPLYSIESWFPYIHNISRTEYGGGTQNWSIVQDANGWIYAANNDGLLQYDGNSWHLYQDRMFRSVLPDNQGRIYVGGFNRFGYYSPDQQGALQYHSLEERLPAEYRNFNDIWNIYSIDHLIYFVSYNYIFKLSGEEFTVIESSERMMASANIHGNLYVYKEGAGVFLQTGTLFIPLASTEKITGYHISAILPFSDEGILLVTEYNGIYHYTHSTTTPVPVSDEKLIRDSQLYCGEIRENKLYLGTIKNGLLTLDLSTGSVTQYDTHSGLQNNSVLSLHVTPGHTIWLGLDNGISYLKPDTPLSNLYTTSQNYGVGYTSVIHQGTIYLGTNQGLYHTRWPIDTIRHLHLLPVENGAGQIWSLIPIGNTLFCGHNNGAYTISGGKAKLISSQSGFWNFHPLPDHPEKILAGTYNGLAVLINKGTSGEPDWQFSHTVQGFELSCRKMEYDETTGLWWIVHGLGFCAVQLNENSTAITQVTFFDNPGQHETYLFKSDGKVFFTTPSGICHYEETSQSFIPAISWNERLQTNYYLRIVKQDPYNRIWYIYNNKLCINYPENSVYHTDSISTAPLANNLMSTYEHIHVVDSTTAIIATLDGFSLHQPKDPASLPLTGYRFGVRSLTLSSGNNEASTWYFNPTHTTDSLKTITHPYQAGASYRFRANPHIATHTGTTYYVQLQGLDEHPIPLGTNGIKEYTGLREGTYTFTASAHSSYTNTWEKDEIQLRILPPWYRSRIAWLIYLLLIGWFIYSIYRIQTHYLNRQHLRNLEALKEENLRREFTLKEEALEKEKKIVELEKEKLHQDLLLKSQELSNSLFNVMQKQEIFTSIRNDLQKIAMLLRKEQTPEARQKPNRLLEKVHTHIADEDNWQKLENNFNIVHNNFFARLKERYPSLTMNDLKLAAYIRMDLITKEVAPLFNLSERGLESARLRLRRKLELKREESLSRFLQEF